MIRFLFLIFGLWITKIYIIWKTNRPAVLAQNVLLPSCVPLRIRLQFCQKDDFKIDFYNWHYSISSHNINIVNTSSKNLCHHFLLYHLLPFHEQFLQSSLWCCLRRTSMDSHERNQTVHSNCLLRPSFLEVDVAKEHCCIYI